MLPSPAVVRSVVAPHREAQVGAPEARGRAVRVLMGRSLLRGVSKLRARDQFAPGQGAVEPPPAQIGVQIARCDREDEEARGRAQARRGMAEIAEITLSRTTSAMWATI